MAHARFARGEYTAEGGKPEWIEFIRVCNGVKNGMFGRPTSNEPWWAGGTVEEYPDARVIHREDPSVSIVSKTEEGERVMREAATQLGIHLVP